MDIIINFSVKFLKSSVKASHQLFSKLYEKLPHSSKEQHVTDSIKVAVSLIFHSVAQFNVYAQDHSDVRVIDPAELVQETLLKFLNRNYGAARCNILDGPKEMKVPHTL